LKDYYRPDADILQEIVKIRKQMTVQIKQIEVQFVPGHQDKNKEKILSPDALLNVEADKLATLSLKMKPSKIKNTNLANASLMIQDLLVTGDHKQILQKTYLSMELREYMEVANKWQKNEIEYIWWKVYAKSMSELGEAKKKFIQKFVHNKLPTNCQQNKRYTYRSPICRVCDDAIETQQHIIICTACPHRHKIRNKYIVDLSTYLDNQRTNNATKIILLQKV
jgi:hypothetical protein